MMLVSEGAAGYSAAAPDLVYVVRPGEDNEELRYSLRSIRNLPHHTVWIFGSAPSWVSSRVGLVQLRPLADKFANQRQSLTAAVNHPGVSRTFVLMNDDMFVTEKTEDELPVWHLGPTSAYIDHLFACGKRKNDWIEAVSATARWVGGDPLCYEAHIPLLFDKQRLRGVLDAYPVNVPFAAGEVYDFAKAGPRGHLGACVKATDKPFRTDVPFLSTEDWSFREQPVGAHVRRLFPEKSEYEK